jgi:hypothetical protein
LAGLQRLKTLDISNCDKVRDLWPLADLHGLESLDLYGCRPAPRLLLEALIKDLSLIELRVTEAVDVPREMLSQGPYDDCLPRLRAYLSELTEKKAGEVFISYAWEDETPAGQVRGRTVEGLVRALETHGFRSVLDRDVLQPGRRISTFMRSFTRADLVVAVISEKYLFSLYCLYEIYKIWQKCRCEVESLAQVVVSIVLPDVKIASLRDRAVYLTFWAGQAKELEALVRNPDLYPRSKSKEEALESSQFTSTTISRRFAKLC